VTEDEARDWLLSHYGAAKFAMLERYVTLLVDETSRQNLISPSSIAQIWSRHIVDSAQLLPMAEQAPGRWIDIGSGAGLPGVVIATLRDGEMMLIEPRRKRAEFLERCAEALGLNKVSVRCCRAEVAVDEAAVISARAVGAIEQIFVAAAGMATDRTVWLLPRGLSGEAELAQAQKSWHGTFHVEQSLTHAGSTIVVARGVYRL
jgi:16S rRNA (guanine527-N7)-methyltransferase